MARYVTVDRDECIGCGHCEEIAPDIFELDDEGLAFVTLDENQGTQPMPEEKMDQLAEAFEECPTEAIQIADHPFNKPK
ncbi:ferredoxin [Marinococcus sp. PL1-022]|uniref:ferredoxin n=1 Tax=Marinococcus sp. PL1-022 TaxID=3095363 RepID=UPI0029C45994|nr:ferredoxin [Marinococcus sp. PL1-022]MDX6152701.1 ferredoxin [Marinococcus sp. PL1-022]